MALLIYSIILTLSHSTVSCNDVYGIEALEVDGIQALVTRIDALEKTAELQKKHIRSQEESIQLLRRNDEKQQKRIEELEEAVQVQHKVISDVISRDSGEKSRDKWEENQTDTPRVASEIKDSLETLPELVGVSGPNMTLLSGLEHLRESLKYRTRRQTPEVVAFHATIDVESHLTKLTIGQAIVFDSVHLNVGGGYHSSTGLFIAPTGGLYMFSLSIMLNTGTSSWIDLDLIKNGNALTGAYAFGYDQGSVSMVTQLIAGDEVLVKVRGPNDAILYGGKLSSFMGVLMH